MSRLALYLLGTPRIELDGAPVELPQRKALALLAYLAVTRTRHTRDRLATLLWPEAEPQRAYAYLRNALWQLNQTPLGPWLAVERESVGLAAERELWVDVSHLEQQLAACGAHAHPAGEVCATCLPLLTEAARTYRGDFLAGFHAGDSAEFDEWQFFQTEHLRQAIAHALDRLTRFHNQGSAEAAKESIGYAQQWLALDPLSEAAHRRLMLLYARAGERAAALRQYEQAMRALKEGLNVTPSRETVELYRRIRAGEIEARDAPSPETTALPAQRPPSVPEPPIQQRLPTPATPFVGRASELAEVLRLLANPECRLLTVTGAGGIGKTRLALEAAPALSQAATSPGAAPPQESTFVPLAPVTAPAFLPSALTDALGITPGRRPSDEGDDADGPSETAYDAVLDYLRGRSLLLVLDNAEHLVPPALGNTGLIDLIAAILAQAPGVKLLVTSRARLELTGEWVLALEGMPCPAAAPGPDSVWSDAVQLFVSCARRAAVDFAPTPQELQTICRICGLVGGLPLGIELAAAWVRLLPCEEIATELEKSLDFLATTMRDVPARHRSLRAAFEHSWILLTEEGRAAYRRLGVFPGAFTREAARDVAGLGLPGLAELVDRSLLHRQPDGRYTLPVVLRQYAVEKLSAAPEERAAVEPRFAAHYLSLLARSAARMPQGRQVGETGAGLGGLATEMDAIRQACSWAATRGEVAMLRQAALPLYLAHELPARHREGAETFHRLVTALSDSGAPADPQREALAGLLEVMEGALLRAAGPRLGGYEAIERGLARLESLGLRPLLVSPDGSPARPGTAELALAQVLSVHAGAHPWRWEQIRRLQESLSVFQAHSQDEQAHWLIALATLLLGQAQTGDADGLAEANLQRALSSFMALSDLWGEAQARFALGILAETQGNLPGAQARIRESLELQRARHVDPDSIAICLNALGRLARRQGECADARQHYEESLTLYQNSGNRWGVAYALSKLGLIAYEAEDYAETRRMIQESLELYTELGSRYRMAEATRLLGDTALAEGDLTAARQHYEKSLWISSHNPWTHLGLGRLALATGRGVAARQYFRQALRHIPPRWPTPPPGLEVVAGIAELRLREGAPETAAEILGFIQAHPLLSHTEQEAMARLEAALVSALPAERREAAVLRGRLRKLGDFTHDLGPEVR